MSQGHATQLLKHGMAEITPALRLHYGTGGNGNRIIVLLHGSPQTENKEQSSERMGKCWWGDT